MTIVELADRLLLKEEPDAGALVAESLSADGVDVRLATRAIEVRRAADGARRAPARRRTSGAGHDSSSTRILVVAGRRPRTVGIGLQAAGVRLDERGAVVVDDRLRTSARRIYAAGDVTALLPFTHVAAHHARVATVNALLGTRRSVDEIDPLGHVHRPGGRPRRPHRGPGAGALRGPQAIVARSDYATLDRAITEAEPHGFALLVADPQAAASSARRSPRPARARRSPS